MNSHAVALARKPKPVAEQIVVDLGQAANPEADPPCDQLEAPCDASGPAETGFIDGSTYDEGPWFDDDPPALQGDNSEVKTLLAGCLGKGLKLDADGLLPASSTTEDRAKATTIMLSEFVRRQIADGTLGDLDVLSFRDLRLRLIEPATDIANYFGLPISRAAQAAGSVADEFCLSRAKLETIADVLARQHDQPARIPTGNPDLDFALHGGVHPAALTLFQGPPGVGKTTFLAQLGLNMARAGIAVLWIAFDEGAPDVALRLAQMLKFRATDVISRESDAMRQARKILAKLPFVAVDAEQGEVTIETVVEHFADKFPNQPRAVIVDSIQTASTESSAPLQDPRSKLDAVIATLKSLANKEGTRCAVLATVELSRSAYRSVSRAHQIDPLAAGKESGALEYRANAVFDIRSETGAPDVVNITAVKVRGYGTHRGHVFAMKLNRETATFEPTPLGAAAKEADQANDLRLLKLVHLRPNSGTNELRVDMAISPKTFQVMMARLRNGGFVDYTEGPRKKQLWSLTTDGRARVTRPAGNAH